MTDSPLGADVRMRGFSRRTTVVSALRWVDGHSAPLKGESTLLKELAGRVLGESIVSDFDVPGFDRAMMDGYALRADETHGASPYNHLFCQVIGESLAGSPFSATVDNGQAVRIMTGAPVPTGADAVLPAEQCHCDNSGRLQVMGEVSPGKHIGRRGEDVQKGDIVLPAGRRLRPQDVGILSSIGVDSSIVIRRPQVRIVTTGDELLAPGTPPSGCQIADANSPMLAALIRRDGGVPMGQGIVVDDPSSILSAMRVDADVVLVSGGSSVGQEDHAPLLLDKHGTLAVHGVAMRPSSPAGMGQLGQALVFLLPGNPVSCLCAYDFFAGRAIRRLAGLPTGWPYATRVGRLRRKLVSTVGRTDYARVLLIDDEIEPLAVSGASVLSSTTRADGFVIVPADSEGHAAGASVTMFCYETPTTAAPC